MEENERKKRERSLSQSQNAMFENCPTDRSNLVIGFILGFAIIGSEREIRRGGENKKKKGEKVSNGARRKL